MFAAFSLLTSTLWLIDNRRENCSEWTHLLSSARCRADEERMKRSFSYGRLTRLVNDDSGQTLIVAAFGMVALAGCLGLAIDVGQIRYQQRQLQTQTDATALAAALELPSCNGVHGCAAMQTAARAALAENGVTGATLTRNCQRTSAAATALSLNNPPCALGTADANGGNAAVVEVVLTRPQTTYFAGVFGYSTVSVSARSEAMQTSGASTTPSGGAVLVE